MTDKSGKKDIDESDYSRKWKVLTTGVACIVLISLVVILEVYFLRGNAIHWKVALFLIALFLTAIICRRFIIFLAKTLNQSYMKHFSAMKELGTFKEAYPLHNNPEQKIDHAVLLLHGFTASSQQLSGLAHKLTEYGLTFYLPSILGFGLNSTRLLQAARYENWCLSALECFDNLQMCAKQISIVGHSMGGLLATFIAQHRPIKHLVLSAPAFYSVERDILLKKKWFDSYLSFLYCWVIPFVPKLVNPGRKTTSDTLRHPDRSFQYMAIPTSAIKEFFKLQSAIDITKGNAASLSILYGKEDITIDNLRTLNYLTQHNIEFTAYCFENSAHNIFEDNEKDTVCDRVIEVLKNQ